MQAVDSDYLKEPEEDIRKLSGNFSGQMGATEAAPTDGKGSVRMWKGTRMVEWAEVWSPKSYVQVPTAGSCE